MKKLLCVALSVMLLLSSCKGGNIPDNEETSSAGEEIVSSSPIEESVPTEESEIIEESEPLEESSSEAQKEESSSAIQKEEKELVLSVTDRKKYDDNFKKTGTYTGKEKLEKLTLNVPDPKNSRGLSETSSGYSFGVAKDEKAHNTSLNHQSRYEKNGYNALTVDTKTKEKVLYLTFDCGYEVGYTSTILDILKEKEVPAAFFCTLSHIKKNPELIARSIEEGHIIANHSVNHLSMPSISREEMAEEILGVENYLREYFGYSSPYFRFPTGAYSDSSLDLVTGIGFRSVFWSVAYKDYDTKAQPGKNVAFETVTSRLHPGAVILLHNVSSSNTEALSDIIDYAKDNGYTFKSLDDYSGWIK